MLKGQSLSLGDSKTFAVRSDLGWIVARNIPSEDMFPSIAVNSIQVVTDELVIFGRQMELVSKNDYAKKEAYYLPHLEVLRDSSTTTKLRVVFDA
ncbi:hypothetical protein TNCV_2176731 [Trichonephila clavipes]|uniref:Uncharacterized protein n=1 Tax=Trichonephila clavipes TaxID=2585209 RepID=A0A8X7B8Z3_TRICX|nr:hypothetical protein TNCV_2176731 [Trichonephila clavipes]